jgi:hypothetical protein
VAVVNLHHFQSERAAINQMAIKISSNSFFTYLVAQSTSRIAKVRAAKKMMEAPRDDYRKVDYWLSMRTSAVAYLCDTSSKSTLDSCLAAIADPKKSANYRDSVDGLKKWVGRKMIVATEISSAVWISGELRVSVTPEIALSWQGSPTYVVKLYFGSEPLSKYYVGPMLRLLESTHGNQGVAAVLDVRRHKLHQGPTSNWEDLDILLKTEAAGFVAMWNSITI